MHNRKRLLLILVASGLLMGCSRQHYRVRADRDGYCRVFEKSSGTPWMPSSSYSVYPAANSRLHDPTPTEDPCLPLPAPQLYEYELPALPPRDDQRFTQSHQSSEVDLENHDGSIEQLAPPEPAESAVELPVTRAPSDPLDHQASHRSGKFAPVSFQPPPPEPPQVNLPDESVPARPQPSTDSALLNPDPVEQLGGGDATADGLVDDNSASEETLDDASRTKLVPLPKSYWEKIPAACLARMLEFDTVRAEYKSTYGSDPSENLLDDSPKLALEDIIDLTMLNSRELQNQKEQLFRVALALTLERFDYQLRPSVGGNGTAADYTHNRVTGIDSRSGRLTRDSLQIPSSLQLEKMLYTGGDILGRFANSVLLTWNGPQGFAADVSSELLFSLSQSLLQRDVRLENLTQAERNVVYAARDFARFRKELFVQQASDYYSLIRQFRQVEINCQNYFTLSREFNQRSVEIEYGFAARTQLDQVEQQVINGRQSILSTCTSLENALDSLKIRMGIPTEQPLNLDLSELNLLTLRDELAVNAELIERTRIRVIRDQDSSNRAAFVIVGTLIQLVEQMLDSIELREQLGEDTPDTEPLQRALLALRIEEADINIREDELSLKQQLDEANPDAIKVIQRRRDAVDELAKKISWQIKLLQRNEPDASAEDPRVTALEGFVESLRKLEATFRLLTSFRLPPGSNETTKTELLRQSEALQNELARITAKYDDEIGRESPADDVAIDDRALEFADALLQESEGFRDTAGGGLVPVQIDMDDAMMTALVQRFDLMNQRGFLADDWRQIKYAADDLRSVLNLQASQSIRTRRDENRPFDLTFDDSTTSVGVTLDLPFNRRSQRNQYRSSLFNYQQSLRNVMQLEDGIKLSVRRDLRALDLDRRQYGNDIAGAALAASRVTGAELEVRLGLATSRDFLEAQTAYVQSVSNVASRHINYIVGRLQLFLDLESLTVGENGFWDKLYDEKYQPEAYYQLQGYEPAYGRLHPKLKYSPRIQRMRCVPDGQAMVHRYDDEALDEAFAVGDSVMAVEPPAINEAAVSE